MLKFKNNTKQVVCCKECNRLLALKIDSANYRWLGTFTLSTHSNRVHKHAYSPHTSNYYG